MKSIILAALWGLAHASPAPLQNLAPRACKYTAEDAKPKDIPQGNYKSAAGNVFYPVGEQQGKILMEVAPRIKGLYDAGGGEFPGSNSFATALKQCTAICDKDQRCKSINILVIAEGDFNDCRPTWQCRFADTTYDPRDYKVTNGPPSYVWSRSPWVTTPPDCSFSKTSDITPAAWNNRNMDGYLSTLATQLGITNQADRFLSSLMDRLGYSPYTCTGADMNSCPSVSRIQTCGDWVNYVNHNFQAFTRNNINVLEKIVDNLETIGQDIFLKSWWVETPSKPSFNMDTFMTTAVNTLVGLIPTVGKGARVGLEQLEKLYSSLQPKNPVGVTPRDLRSWAEFISKVRQGINSAQGVLSTAARDVTQTNRFLTEVAEGGTWSIPDPQSPEVMINPDTFWPQAEKYYAAKVAMEALRAQSVFIVARYIGKDKCTQQSADILASNINGGPKGVGFCQNNYAMVPVMGWNQKVYDTWGTMVSAAKSSNMEVMRPSITCSSGYRIGNPLYFNDNQKAKIRLGGAVSYNMDGPCAWSVPICDIDRWIDFAKDWAGRPHKDYVVEGAEETMNALYSCAYNWGMIDKIKWCGYFKAMTTQGGPWEDHHCTDWRPAKEVEAQGY